MVTHVAPALPLQVSVRESIDQAIADSIEYLPVVVGALVILLAGYIIGRILGGVVTRVIRRLGVGRYVEGTAVEEVGDGDSDAIARLLGKVISYYVYFVAIIAAADVLGISQLTDLLAEIGVFLPVILGALIVLVIGFIIGRIVGDVVSKVVDGFNIGQYLRETPLEQFGETEGEFGRIVGKLVAYYIYLLTILTVADILRIDALSSLLNDFAGYLPSLAAGLLVLLVGIWLAERVADIVSESGDGRPMVVASLVVKVFIYYMTITVVLSTIGVNASPLTNLFTVFVVAFFGALGLALALGIGIAVGLGGQDFVAENIDEWFGTAKDSIAEEQDETGE
ncbi:mechanosensitive ion channel family protein [Halovenus marina]|uniref:mechanosensitive ion channel family protein n=1 Tax=Halovenus marina TaxID=3396621 RepID=UPI003F555E68